MAALTKNLDQILESFEKNIVEKTLKDTHGNQSKAAQLLGITKRKIQYKIEKYGIDCKSIKEQFSNDKNAFHTWHHFSHVPPDEKNQRNALLLP